MQPCMQIVSCLLEEDSERSFVGFLREEDADNGSWKHQKTPMGETTSSDTLSLMASRADQ